MSAGAMRYCPICGAVNSPDAERCVSCRRVLPEPPNRSDQDPNTPAPPTGGVSWGDPFGGTPGASNYPDYDYPGYQPNAAEPPIDDPAAQPAAAYAPTYPPYVPFSAYTDGQDDRYGAAPPSQSPTYDTPESTPGDTIVTTPPRVLPPPPRRQSGGRGGCVMGCLAALIIGLVAAALVVVGIVRPVLQDEVGDELERVVATQIVRQLAPGDGTPELTAGTYTISAAEINDELRENADDYEPLDEPQVTIDQDGLELSFDAYGTESSYRGGVAVENGRLVLTDVEASGLASRVLPADDVQEIIERELNNYVAAAGLIVTGVELEDGALNLTTASDSTPRATPAADESDTTPAPRAAGPTRTPTRPTPRVVAPPRATTTPTPRPTEEPEADAEPTARPTRTPEPDPDEEATGTGL